MRNLSIQKLKRNFCHLMTSQAGNCFSDLPNHTRLGILQKKYAISKAFIPSSDTPDTRKYDYIAFPEPDIWGVVMPHDAPLAIKEKICIDDLIGLPLFSSRQGWENDISRWCGKRRDELHLEGSFRLAYNASVFVKEGLGYQLCLDHLINTSPKSGLVFRPLYPRLEARLFLIWNKYQTFTPIAERFLAQVKNSFAEY